MRYAPESIVRNDTADLVTDIGGAVSPLAIPARLNAKDRAAVVAALQAKVGSWASPVELAEKTSVRLRRLPGWPLEVAILIKDRTVAIGAALTPAAERRAIARGLACVVLNDADIAFVDRDVNVMADALLAAEVAAADAVSP
jgi:hypothetical protein